MVLNYNSVLYSYYVGGELKRPGRTYVYASCISIALLVVVWVGIWVLLRWRIGLDFMQSQANLGASDGDAYGKITSLRPRPAASATGSSCRATRSRRSCSRSRCRAPELAVNLAFVAVITRVLFSLAFDRMLPVSVAR